MSRMGRDEFLVAATKLISLRGTCKRAQVGAVIALDGRILSSGYNGSPPGEKHCLDVGCDMQHGHCVRTIHAESNAIAWAARKGISVEGASMYVYGWVTGGDLGICSVCSKIAKSAGIKEVIIIPYEKTDVNDQSSVRDMGLEPKTARVRK